jgi:hypothetical protein
MIKGRLVYRIELFEPKFIVLACAMRVLIDPNLFNTSVILDAVISG